MRNHDAMMGTGKTDWETPKELFEPLNKIFRFDMDVCATEENKKVEVFISPEQDAFLTPWGFEEPFGQNFVTHGPAICWMNPPYGKPEYSCKPNCKKKVCEERGHHNLDYVPGIGDWIRRAVSQSVREDGGPGSTVVCLTPAWTGTDWFQEIFRHAKMLVFLKGRVKFVGAKNGATHPSVISVFSPQEMDDVVVEGMQNLGNVITPLWTGLIRKKKSGIYPYGGGEG